MQEILVKALHCKIAFVKVESSIIEISESSLIARDAVTLLVL